MAARVKVVKNRLPELAPRLAAAADRAIDICAHRIHGRAVSASPVDTGALKGSWSVKRPAPFVAIIGSDQEHSIYNEFGTRNMAARPMLRPAAAAELPTLQIVLVRIIQEATRV